MTVKGAPSPKQPPAKDRLQIEETPHGVTISNAQFDTNTPTASDWRHVFERFHLDPESFELIDDTVRMSSWDQSASYKGVRETVKLYSFKASFRRINKNSARDISALIREAKKTTRKRLARPANREGFIHAIGDLQLGKALWSGTPILTTRGWTTHGKLRVGDSVYDINGTPAIVQHVYPTTVRRLYRVNTNDGSCVDASDDHQWVTRWTHPDGTVQPDVTASTTDIAKGLKNGYKITIPPALPVRSHPEEPIPTREAAFNGLFDSEGIYTPTDAKDAHTVGELTASLGHRYRIVDRTLQLVHGDITITSIDSSGYGEAQCIQVSGGTYLAGSRLTPTHNCDGDGSQGIVDRTVDSVEAARRHIEKNGGYKHVHAAWLGDCVEGLVSQGGRNATRMDMTLTESIDMLEQLMLHQIKTLAPYCKKMTVVSVPGNHDETSRQFGTRYDDSFAVQALRSVERAIRMNTAFDHVECIVPERDELTVTVEVAGTRITHAHGHQWRRGKHWEWWEGQTFSGQEAAGSDLLLCGHEHHFTVDTRSRRTFVRVPSLESESTWWRHGTGQVGDPGGTFMTTNDGKVAGITVA